MKNFLFILGLIALLAPSASLARENVDYWYIKNFESEIKVNKDSSLDITEKITADSGSANKHGIFRILPTVQYSDKKIPTKVELLSITDFEGNPHPYKTIYSYLDKTVTWKIGSEDKFVSGVNNYLISYRVENAIRHQENFSELYWNLSGAFWDIPIDSFSTIVHFPGEINKDNINLNIYSGRFGDKNSLNPTLEFKENILRVSYPKTINEGEGITISATFPKGIASPYTPSFFEKYGSFLFFLIPILIFLLCLKLWKKYGKDPKVNPTIAPEFEIPDNLSPIDMGLVLSDGTFNTNYLSASIINLAVKGHIKIKQISEKTLLKTADYELEKVSSSNVESPAEAHLLKKLFGSGKTVQLSSLKNTFYVNLQPIANKSREHLFKQKLLVPYSKLRLVLFYLFGGAILISAVASLIFNSLLAISLILTGLIILSFAPLMSKRNKEGHEMYRRILGFKLYLDKAEKYRQRYLESQDLFEKLLPYAIMFGITTKWIKTMKSIYGEKYFATYHPIWFYGHGITSFNADAFSSQLNQISSNMAATMSSSPSSSGSGGGGFSGGGGGGGGGGGW